MSKCEDFFEALHELRIVKPNEAQELLPHIWEDYEFIFFSADVRTPHASNLSADEKRLCRSLGAVNAQKVHDKVQELRECAMRLISEFSTEKASAFLIGDSDNYERLCYASARAEVLLMRLSYVARLLSAIIERLRGQAAAKKAMNHKD